MNNNEHKKVEVENPTVAFVGAGPGADDLITVRGLRLLQNADLVLYAGSLVSTEHLQACKAECEFFDTASMNLEEQVLTMSTAAKAGKQVVRLHTGDPAMYGAINEQIKGLHAQGVATYIVPGVSSVFAAAAALGCELTAPDVSQSVVLTRTPGRTPMPEKEKASDFAKTGATLVFFLSTGKIAELMQDLMTEGEVQAQTPAVLVYRVSWPDERIIRGTVADIAQKCADAGIGRQALILVGNALGQHDTSSLLYDKSFSHGYRNTLVHEQFVGACALYAFTQKGLSKAVEIATGLQLPTTIYCTYKNSIIPEAQKHSENLPKVQIISGHDFDGILQEQWQNFAAHIFVCATGIAVRKVAKLLEHKSMDPAVIACPESGAHIISLTSGHLGGANRLSRRIARITGGQAVIGTATDGKNVVAFDELAAMENARIMNVDAIKTLNMALLHKKDVSFLGPQALYVTHYADNPHVHFVENLAQINTKYAVIWCDGQNTLGHCHIHKHLQKEDVTYLKISSKALVLGMGCRKNMDSALFEAQVQKFLDENTINPKQIACFATCDVKTEEKAMLDLSQKWNIPLEFHAAADLNTVIVPNPSVIVKEKLGTSSVCEASALLSAGYATAMNVSTRPRLYRQKKTLQDMTLAVAKIAHGHIKGHKKKIVVVVGLGSGESRHITPEVDMALRRCDVVAGYDKYVDFIRDRIAGKAIIQNGMMGEVKRCTETLNVAAGGKSVCMVCSGDPGILAMAGLLFELKAQNEAFKDVSIEVLPGVTAANLAAASLGAPLQNGFSLVSLSDLLVPTAEVRQNLQAVAQSALPIVLYNPAGKKRRALLHEALNIFKEQRGDEIFCAYVRHAGRVQEEKWVGKLCQFPQDEVDMSTLIVIGSERTQFNDNVLYEARGYVEKYLVVTEKHINS